MPGAACSAGYPYPQHAGPCVGGWVGGAGAADWTAATAPEASRWHVAGMRMRVVWHMHVRECRARGSAWPVVLRAFNGTTPAIVILSPVIISS